MTFDSATLSCPGARAVNQDATAVEDMDGVHCCVLADGLGGHGGGEQAARTAVEAVLDSFRTHAECSAEAVRNYFEAAARAVALAQEIEPSLSSMRTTLVVLVASESEAVWGHIGDSRLYRLRTGAIESQTRDHSVPQALADSGRIAPSAIRFHEDRNRLLRSLGSNGTQFEGTIQQPVAIQSGDSFLLATDGFWEPVTETEMEAEYAKSQSARDWLERMEQRLRGRASSDQDNYSAIAVILGSHQ